MITTTTRECDDAEKISDHTSPRLVFCSSQNQAPDKNKSGVISGEIRRWENNHPMFTNSLPIWLKKNTTLVYKNKVRTHYSLDESYPLTTKHLYNICAMLDQRRRRWADVVQMLYKCFVFAGYSQSQNLQRFSDDNYTMLFTMLFTMLQCDRAFNHRNINTRALLLKGPICHFELWQMRPFNNKVTILLVSFHLNR